MREFASYQGLRQHMRRAHPVEYNAELEQADKRKNTAWSRQEEYDMAMAEIAYQGLFVNQHLTTIFAHRTLDSIKGHRRSKAYKDLIERIRSDQEEAAPDSTPPGTPLARGEEQVTGESDTYQYLPDGTITPPRELRAAGTVDGAGSSLPASPLVPGNDDISRSTGQANGDAPAIAECAAPVEPVPPRAPTPAPMALLRQDAPPFVPTPVDPVLDYVIELSRLEGLQPGFKDCLLAAARAPTDPRGLVNSLHDLVVSACRVKNAARVCPRVAPATVGRTHRRAFLYKKAQNLYRTNRAQLASSVIGGTLEEEERDRPPMEAVEETYRRVFGSPSVPDPGPVTDPKPRTIHIYSPITVETIVRSLARRMSEAAGTDGISASELRKVPVPSLASLFNVMLLLGVVPDALKKCRTTLIPKSGADLKTCDGWRPITVTSVILRLFNKLLADRFQQLDFHPSQRGFTTIDGTLANTATLQSAIKSCRARLQPHTVVTLDLRRAFDSVSWSSVKRAMQRFSVEERIIGLVMDAYEGTTTTITCGGATTGLLSVTRGVKQGDPLSPLLFNLVMDELLCDLHKLPPGLSFEGVDLTTLAYADDLVLFAGTPADAQSLVRRCQRFLEKRQMELNPDKCTALVVRLLPNAKKLYVATRSRLFVAGGFIRPITVGEQFKYLGFRYSFTGSEAPLSSGLVAELARVSRAPLKPWQKLVIIRDYLLPRYLYILQAMNITLKTLQGCDRSVRLAIKKTLHLPKSTPNSFLYAAQRHGGLGVTCFATKIPSVLVGRFRSLERVADGWLAGALSTEYVVHRVGVLEDMVDHLGAGAGAEAAFWAARLEASVSGNGVAAVGRCVAASSWISDPPPFWTGRDYVSAVLLRSNMLPVKGGVHNAPEHRRCRAGCNRTESLSHVLQRCPATHFERIKRHDRVVGHLADAARRAGWTVEVEPRLRDSEGRLRKPDLVFINNTDIITSDVGIHWEGPEPLEMAATDKIRHYSDGSLQRTLQGRYPGRSYSIVPFILGARGGYCASNVELSLRLGLPAITQRRIMHDLLKGGWTIHRAFSRVTWEPRV